MAKKGQYGYREDLTGKRYGKLLVKKYAGYEFNNRGRCIHLWECVCDCGTIKVLPGRALREGKTNTCGCSRQGLKNSSVKHNYTGTPIYQKWRGMKNRCYNSKNNSYKNYGGRGIKMCEEWKNDFMAFRTWAYANGYDETKGRDCTIDRIDVNGNYEPSNCRFISLYEQADNTTKTRRYDVYGEMITKREASRKYNITYKLLCSRISRGMTLKDAIELGKVGQYHHKLFATVNGVTKTLSEWCNDLDLDYKTVYARIKRGQTPEEALLYKFEKVEPITINGVTKTVTEWSRENGIKPSTALGRIYNGWNPIKAVTTTNNCKYKDKIPL